MLLTRASSRTLPSPIAFLVVMLSSGAIARADDWPSWRGPGRDGLSKETGLLRSWPKGGPPLAWKATGVGEGFSSVTVSKGQIYTMGNRGGKELVLALDVKGGKEAWAGEVGPCADVDYSGPRCSPTVDGELLYALGADGVLVCLETEGGKERWRKSFQADFGGERPHWGYAESPFIDGGRVIVTPGGSEATLAALDKLTGAVEWRAAVPRDASDTSANPRRRDRAQYSSVIPAEVGGVKLYIQFLRSGVAGVAAKDGKFLWRYDRPANGTANISTPVFRDGLVFTASGYGTGGGLAKLAAEGGGVKASEVYFTKKMRNHHGGVVLVGDHLYGFDDGGGLTCIEFKKGGGKDDRPVWQNRSVGKGSVLYADGHLYCRSENGPIALVEATPKGYVEKGRFNQPDRSRQHSWPHPVIASGILYIRDQDVLLAYDVRAGGNRGKSGQVD